MELSAKSDRRVEEEEEDYKEEEMRIEEYQAILKDSDQALYINPQESSRATWFRARVSRLYIFNGVVGERRKDFFDRE